MHTKNTLRRDIAALARRLDLPDEAYRESGNGFAAQPGALIIDHMQPGGRARTYHVAQITNATGGERNLSERRMSAAECAAFLAGMAAALDILGK
jgi:hypothetical protein